MRFRLLGLASNEHELLLTMHHVVSDGWSMAVFGRELSALYASERSGMPVALAPLPVQVADVAVWQQRWLGERLALDVEAYRAHLADLPPALELPTDHARPAALGPAGATVDIAISRDLSDGLESLGRQEGATPFMVLLAGLEVLLHRLSDATSFAVGTPVAQRDRPEVEDLIGFFANTIALRADLSGDPTFRTLLGRVRIDALFAYGHQHVPFERVVEAVAPPRDLSRTPIFQVMLTLQNTPGVHIELPGLEVDLLAADPGVAKFDLTVSLQETSGGLTGVLEYARDLFEPETASRIADQFVRILQGAVEEPDRPISRLPLMGVVERRRVLEEWAGAEQEAPAPLWLELLAARVRAHPDTVAVEGEREALTYGELDRRANQLAHRLIELGVQPETRVGICMERAPELFIALYAVLKAGGAYVPLDPRRVPPQQLAWRLEDAGVPVVITDRASVARLPTGVQRLLPEDEVDLIAACPATAPLVAIASESAAYVVYTSGSTGRPKGVVVEHRQVARLAAWSGGPGLGAQAPGSRALQLYSPAFDAFLIDVLPALCGGGTLVLAPDEGLRPDATFLEWCVARRINRLDLVTAFWHTLVDLVDPAGLPDDLQAVGIG
ncbi:MAG: AMP-binding protein, partial [Myxococcales bacterium]|nr:AMP-binding protein [Myxococcales bacterium]